MLGKAPARTPGPLRGEVIVPPDKSISHRALVAGSFDTRPLCVAALNRGRDVHATRKALEALGASIEDRGDGVIVRGSLSRRLAGKAPVLLDCMNSGSTARMMLGVCAGADLAARFDGDASLHRRPMEPVAAQLRAFGAKIETAEGRMPVTIWGRPAVETRRFILIAPSAQVKTALLFAALFAGVDVRVSGDRQSRDHTERLLRYLGAAVEWDGKTVELGRGTWEPRDVQIAGDFSSAAFFITAATIAAGSALLLPNVGVNPTRTGLLDALERMGARVELRNARELSGEPVADVTVTAARLEGIHVGRDTALRAIDEIVLLAIAAAFARGTTTIDGVADLRTKESDRVAGIERLLRAAGIDVHSERDRITIEGGAPRSSGETVQTHHDHRIAMGAAVLACAAGPIPTDDDSSVDVSFPEFFSALERIRT